MSNKQEDKIYAESIINEYSKKDTSKVIQLKKLDNKVKQGPFIFSLTFGIVSSLILGLGMCLSMKVIGGTNLLTILGIIVGIIGIILISINYPIYKKMLKHNKDKYAEDIMTLAREIADE